jgi:hypothetical protein
MLESCLDHMHFIWGLDFAVVCVSIGVVGLGCFVTGIWIIHLDAAYGMHTSLSILRSRAHLHLELTTSDQSASRYLGVVRGIIWTQCKWVLTIASGIV